MVNEFKWLDVPFPVVSNSFEASFIFTSVQADTASLACPARPGSLEITPRTLAAVMCDAEDPCSVNTAYEPESSFTTSPRSTTPSSVVLKLLVQIRVFWDGTSP